jgi:hypothetical protein
VTFCDDRSAWVSVIGVPSTLTSSWVCLLPDVNIDGAGDLAEMAANRDHRPSNKTVVSKLWRRGVASRRPRRAFAEVDDRIAIERAGITERAGPVATLQVGHDGRTVPEVAADLGCDWHRVMVAVKRHGQTLIDDPNRIGSTTGAMRSTPQCRAWSQRGAYVQLVRRARRGMDVADRLGHRKLMNLAHERLADDANSALTAKTTPHRPRSVASGAPSHQVAPSDRSVASGEFYERADRGRQQPRQTGQAGRVRDHELPPTPLRGGFLTTGASPFEAGND